jgi:large subunit ribosomal protein L16
MLSPKRTKFRKVQKGNNRGLANTGSDVSFGDFGGKGAPEEWAAAVKRGRVLYEIAGVTEDVAREAFRLAGHKLPVTCKFLSRTEVGS